MSLYQPRFKNAFILAAGLGTRMRPLTETIPKPMAQVNGESLIRRAIRKLRESGVHNIAVNAHYYADLLKDHVKDLDVHILYEETLLDTGGGIYNAAQFFGDNQPFYCISGDSWWEDDHNGSIIKTLDESWDDDETDLVLMLQKIAHMHVTKGIGDYHFLNDKKPSRARDQTGTHMWTSMRLLHPRIFNRMNEKDKSVPFSLLPLIDQAEQNGRLKAVELRGIWHHLSTMDDLNAVNEWAHARTAPVI